MKPFLFIGFGCLPVLLACSEGALHDDTDPPQRYADDRAAPRSTVADSARTREWLRSDDEKDSTTINHQRMRLEALGYADGTREAPRVQGIAVHDREEAFQGYNLYTSGHGPQALLMDMEGNILHRWHHGLRSAWPGLQQPEKRPAGFWRRAYLFENGDLLAMFGGVGIIKLDKDSNLLWQNLNNAHHDISLTENGDIHILTRSECLTPKLNPDEPLIDDYITVLDVAGREKTRISILECFQNASEYEHLWLPVAKHGGDAFHTNTVFLIDGRISERIPAFRKGGILTSMRHLDVLAVIDMKLKKVIWAHRGSYDAQHDPQILPNGNMLLFDNGVDSLRSRVLEFDPLEMELVWLYEGSPDKPFYSEFCGTCQRLGNGNTLITETDAGRAFEVTADKRIIWEYYNPHRVGAGGIRIASLFEMRRLPPDFPIHWTHAYPKAED